MSVAVGRVLVFVSSVALLASSHEGEARGDLTRELDRGFERARAVEVAYALDKESRGPWNRGDLDASWTVKSTVRCKLGCGGRFVRLRPALLQGRRADIDCSDLVVSFAFFDELGEEFLKVYGGSSFRCLSDGYSSVELDRSFRPLLAEVSPGQW